MATIDTELDELEVHSQDEAANGDSAPKTPVRNLTHRDSARFVESVENPPAPGERLKRGAANYKQRYA